MSDFERKVFAIAERAVTRALASAALEPHRPLGKFVAEAATTITDQVEDERRAKRSVRWDQRAIAEWQNATFGQPKGNLGIAVRANVEMAELLRCLAKDDGDTRAREEVADVIITLCRLVERLGGTMVRDVDSKMEVNVKRTWVTGPDGHGQHIDPPGPIRDIFRETKEPLCAKCGGTGTVSVPFEPTTVAPCGCRRTDAAERESCYDCGSEGHRYCGRS